jgi:CheY-like chemotaxis protein
MRSVLLVDNRGLFGEVARAIKRRTNCRILTATNGTDALTVARREKPDLIFLDAEMEGMTGVDVCRVLKADKQSSQRPIVLVGGSAYSSLPIENTTSCCEVISDMSLTASARAGRA